MKISTTLVGLVFALLLTSLPQTSHAQIALSQRACQSYASWSGNLVWARDLGADKAKARAELVSLDAKTPATIYALLLRNFDSLWSTNAHWEQVTLVVLQDCINRQGRYESSI